MGNLVQSIFGGGDKPDDSASRVAEAQLQAQREAQAAEERRWKEEMDRVDRDKAALAEKQKQDEAKRLSDIEKAKTEAALQAEAQRATGTGITFNDTRKLSAAALAAGVSPDGIPLPDYKSLSRFNTTPGGYQGQQNSILSTNVVGGRRYV